MSINNWLLGFRTVIVLLLSDLTINSPSALIKSVRLAVFAYSKAIEIGLVKFNLYSKEFRIPAGISVIKSPLFFSNKGTETVVLFNAIGVINFV